MRREPCSHRDGKKRREGLPALRGSGRIFVDQRKVPGVENNKRRVEEEDDESAQEGYQAENTHDETVDERDNDEDDDGKADSDD